MAIIHAVRSDSSTFDARFSYGGKTPGLALQNSAANPPLYESDAGAIGGNRINMDRSSAIFRAIQWNAMRIQPVSTSRAISVLVRCKLGVNSAALGIFTRDGNIANWAVNRLTLYVNSSNQWQCFAANEFGQTAINNINFGTQNIGTSNYCDLVLTWDGTTTANAVKFYIDGVLLGQGTATNPVASTFDWRTCPTLAIGGNSSANNARMYVNEFVVWDTVIDPTGNITLTSGAGLLNGSSRTAFVDVAAFDALNSSGAGAANIRSGTTETINGVLVTGTAAIPGASDVRSGVAVDATTGTLNTTKSSTFIG